MTPTNSVTSTPTLTITPTPTVSVSVTPSITPTDSPIPSVSATPSTTVSPTPTQGLSPTPTPSITPTNVECDVDADITTGTTVSPTPTPTPSISPTPGGSSSSGGEVIFDISEGYFDCGEVAYLTDCNSSNTYYVSTPLSFNGSIVSQNTNLNVTIGGEILCVTYVEDILGTSTHVITSINSTHSDCGCT